MRKPERGHLILALWLLAGCGGDNGDGPPTLALGRDVCAVCRMEVGDARFAAAARTTDGEVLAYDAIECLVRDLRTRRGANAPASLWLPDLGTGVLHASDSVTVVLADFPSPMGGGYAAFLDTAAARAAAAERGGVAGPLAGFVEGTLTRQEP